MDIIGRTGPAQVARLDASLDSLGFDDFFAVCSPQSAAHDAERLGGCGSLWVSARLFRLKKRSFS